MPRIWLSTIDHFHKIITNNSMASYIYVSKYSQVLNGQSRESSFENYDIEELYRNENISVYSVVRFVLSSVLCNLILKSIKSCLKGTCTLNEFNFPKIVKIEGGIVIHYIWHISHLYEKWLDATQVNTFFCSWNNETFHTFCHIEKWWLVFSAIQQQ